MNAQPTTHRKPEQRPEPAAHSTAEEEKRYGLSQWQLMWRKFKRSKTAIIGGAFVVLFYLLRPVRQFSRALWRRPALHRLSVCPAPALHFDFETGVYVNGLTRTFDNETLLAHLPSDTDKKIPDQVLRA